MIPGALIFQGIIFGKADNCNKSIGINIFWSQAQE